jgi:preprotein translocase subunit SecE
VLGVRIPPGLYIAEMVMELREKLDVVKTYFLEVYMEAKRVTWPSKKDALKGTYIVVITVLIAALFLGFVDVTLAWVIQKFIR